MIRFRAWINTRIEFSRGAFLVCVAINTVVSVLSFAAAFGVIGK